MGKNMTINDVQRIKDNISRDFELMLRRFCHRLRDHDDPKVQEVVAQAMDLLKRKGTSTILRDDIEGGE